MIIKWQTVLEMKAGAIGIEFRRHPEWMRSDAGADFMRNSWIARREWVQPDGFFPIV